MKIVSVVGARPQFVKLAPIAQAAKAAKVEHVIIHTGQHYDPMLSDVFFSDLAIPSPAVHLGVGSGRHGEQTGRMLAALDGVLLEHQPDWVLVYGDTNSTLAAALSAVKLHFPVAHLEAGLRSFNRAMPEEHNRVLTDHAADLLLAPTEVAAAHLAREGLASRTKVVGDVMTDVLYKVKEQVLAEQTAGKAHPLTNTSLAATNNLGPYYLTTIHRAENTDDPARLAQIIAALAGLDLPVALLAHPRLRAAAARHGITLSQGAIHLLDPLPYPQLVAAVLGARGVITDSGGLQKESFLLRVPCTTVRTETEWVETVELGWNQLATPTDLAQAVCRPAPPATDAAPYGDGQAAALVIKALQGKI